MAPHIKFRVNPMPLTPLSMAQPFNNFILKKKIEPQSNGPINLVWHKSNGSSVFQGSHVHGQFGLVIGGPQQATSHCKTVRGTSHRSIFHTYIWGNIHAHPVCMVLPCTPAVVAHLGPHRSRDMGRMERSTHDGPKNQEWSHSHAFNPLICGPQFYWLYIKERKLTLNPTIQSIWCVKPIVVNSIQVTIPV